MPVQQAPVHRHLKWAEGTAATTSGKDREIINQRSYVLVTCLLFLLNQVMEGLCLGWEKKRWQDVEGSAVLLHDKQQPGASSDKALIQKIPPSFAGNPNEDLKCSAGRRPGGGVDTPCCCLLSQAIVSLSPYWPSRDGDERDTTGPSNASPRARLAPRDARFHRPWANMRGDIKKEAEAQNQQKLFTKDPGDKATTGPFTLNWFWGNSHVKLVGHCKNWPRLLLEWRGRDIPLHLKCQIKSGGDSVVTQLRSLL